MRKQTWTLAVAVAVLGGFPAPAAAQPWKQQPRDPFGRPLPPGQQEWDKNEPTNMVQQPLLGVRPPLLQNPRPKIPRTTSGQPILHWLAIFVVVNVVWYLLYWLFARAGRAQDERMRHPPLSNSRRGCVKPIARPAEDQTPRLDSLDRAALLGWGCILAIALVVLVCFLVLFFLTFLYK
jgi:hypothetical protein